MKIKNSITMGINLIRRLIINRWRLHPQGRKAPNQGNCETPESEGHWKSGSQARQANMETNTARMTRNQGNQETKKTKKVSRGWISRRSLVWQSREGATGPAHPGGNFRGHCRQSG